MVSRIVSCNIRNDKLNEFTSKLANRYLAQIKQQPGFVDLIESVDSATGHFVCMTLWKTKEDVDRYDRSLFPEIAQNLGPLLVDSPQVQTMTVENSTVHNVQRGIAHAA